jgi:hypothetical protein
MWCTFRGKLYVSLRIPFNVYFHIAWTSPEYLLLSTIRYPHLDPWCFLFWWRERERGGGAIIRGQDHPEAGIWYRFAQDQHCAPNFANTKFFLVSGWVGGCWKCYTSPFVHKPLFVTCCFPSLFNYHRLCHGYPSDTNYTWRHLTMTLRVSFLFSILSTSLLHC